MVGLMRCPKCGGELDGEGPVCSRCSGDPVEVKVLRPDERDDFKGLTIQQGEAQTDEPGYGREEPGTHEYYSDGPRHRVYVRQVSLGSQPFGFLTKLMIAALILFFVFVALPVALILVAVFSLFWWLVRK